MSSTEYVPQLTNTPIKMTKIEFIIICEMLFIQPEVALENSRVVNALREGASNAEIEIILHEEF